MDVYLTGLALFLLLTMLVGLVRIVRGPQPADRMLAIQLFGSTSVAVLLLLAEAAANDALRNVALAFVLLALLTVVAFVERTPPGEDKN